MSVKIKATDLIRKVRCPQCHMLRSHPVDIAMIKGQGQCSSCDHVESDRDYGEGVKQYGQ
jgi:hypothetical protein